MSQRQFINPILLACFGALLALVWMSWSPVDERLREPLPADAVVENSNEQPSRSVMTARGTAHEIEPSVESPDKRRVSPRSEVIEELKSVSTTFRNTSLLMALHAAGYVCEVITEAIDVGDDGWRVECPQALAYSISVSEAGELQITPTLHYYDATPVPVLIPDVR